LQSGSIGITWQAGSQLPHSGEMRLALPFIVHSMAGDFSPIPVAFHGEAHQLGIVL